MTDDAAINQAIESSFSPEQVRPVDVHLDRRDGLRIEWADGHRSHYSLAYLRKRCPCATCRTERPPGPSEPGSGLSLTVLPAGIDRAAQFTSAGLVGRYAMQITWADGHSTGIYDFRYLRAICPASEGGAAPD